MIELLRSQLPSGLTVVNAGQAEFMQRAKYPYVCRTKTVRSPVVAPAQQASHARGACVRGQDVSILDEVLRNVDDMYDIYNTQMRAESKTRFMNHVRDFVGSATGTALVGRKASREVMAYVAQYAANGARARTPDSFLKLCSFLLNARIHTDEKTYEWPGIEMQRDIHLKK